MTDSRKVSISWQDFENDTKALYEKIKATNKTYKGIVVITRGGLTIAGILSRLLNIKCIDILCVSSYDFGKNHHGDLEVIRKPEEAMKAEGKNWLVVDDLIDSGQTYFYAKKILKKCDFACLYNKFDNTEELSDFIYLRNYESSKWIEFPWEIV